MTSYLISELGERTGFSASTLRYYERLGLLTAGRSESGYRQYTDADVTRVRFIANAKALGLSLEDIRDLVVVWDQGRCASVRARLEELLATRTRDVAARIGELTDFSADLERARDRLLEGVPSGPCDEACGCTATAQTMSSEDVMSGRAGELDPPVICTLGAEQAATRIREWADLAGLAVARVPLADGIRLSFPADPGLAGQIASLAAREQACCSFFRFVLSSAERGCGP